MKAVLFKSNERFEAFRKSLSDYNIECTILDFRDNGWLDFDFSKVDLVIYYPSTKYSSNYNLSLLDVFDHLIHIKSSYPHIQIYPDPNAIPYYNDKYKQYLFLCHNDYPIPQTVPLLSKESLNLAEKELGYPMIIKNRYGAAGVYVYRVKNRNELTGIYNLSTFHFIHWYAFKFYRRFLLRRIFFYYLLKIKRMLYPFLSEPLLAQKFVHHERDLKLVVGNQQVVEGHWRRKADERMWKVNIDSGGIGEWSYIPNDAIHIAEKLAKDLPARWLNLDLFETVEGFLISEFSPVWHHYTYKEKPSFVYKDDYNIQIPLEKSLKLEDIIVESFLNSNE